MEKIITAFVIIVLATISSTAALAGTEALEAAKQRDEQQYRQFRQKIANVPQQQGASITGQPIAGESTFNGQPGRPTITALADNYMIVDEQRLDTKTAKIFGETDQVFQLRPLTSKQTLRSIFLKSYRYKQLADQDVKDEHDATLKLQPPETSEADQGKTDWYVFLIVDKGKHTIKHLPKGYAVTAYSAKRAVIDSPAGVKVAHDGKDVIIGGLKYMVMIVPDKGKSIDDASYLSQHEGPHTIHEGKNILVD